MATSLKLPLMTSLPSPLGPLRISPSLAGAPFVFCPRTKRRQDLPSRGEKPWTTPSSFLFLQRSFELVLSPFLVFQRDDQARSSPGTFLFFAFGQCSFPPPRLEFDGTSPPFAGQSPAPYERKPKEWLFFLNVMALSPPFLFLSCVSFSSPPIPDLLLHGRGGRQILQTR